MPTYYAQASATASTTARYKFRKPSLVTASASASATSTESQSDADNSAYSIAQQNANQNANTHANLLSQSVDVSNGEETIIPLGSTLLDGYINQTGTNTWTIEQNYTIPPGYTLVIGADETLNIGSDEICCPTLTLEPLATLLIETRTSVFANYANFENFGGAIINEGTFANNDGIFNNVGIFTNNGTIANGNGYDYGGSIYNFGLITNTGTIKNEDTIFNQLLPPIRPPPPTPRVPTIINDGIFTNNFDIYNYEGTFFYTNSITGIPVTPQGTIERYTTRTRGIVENSGKYAKISNYGTIYCNSYPS